MSKTPSRAETPAEHQWDVESVYTTKEAWEADFSRLGDLIKPVADMKGHLDSPEAVAKTFAAEDALSLVLGRLYLYAHMKEDEDTSVGENQARMSRIRSQFARISGELAFIQPEILAQPEETLRQWTASGALAPYKRSMELLVRQKPHTLSTEEETLLGLAGEVFSTPYDAFGKLTNADLLFDSAKDSSGLEHEVTNGSFYGLLLSSDRELRKAAFGSIYQGYGEHRNSLCSLLSGSTKTHTFNAHVRKFPSALEASLFNDNIPVGVYTSLISAVHEALPLFHEYVDLRARQLGLEGDLNAWDLHVPIVPDFEMKVEWDECRTWIVESLAPYDAEYRAAVKASFDERWYDVYENKGKRSGAYSTHAHGYKPFMLLNYHGTLNDVFTVAHELGHSMHSYCSMNAQPFRYADYPIFLAEIASTTNEALLHEYLMRTKDDPRLKAYLLNHLCDSFRGTLFRQAMFAEFEMEIHNRIEGGGALTAESLSEYYYELNANFHGPKIKMDDRIALEWTRIPHFYYNFYVYKYATGFAAAQIFSQRILSGEKNRDAYVGFLKSGSSRDPLETVRAAGVDLTNPQVLQDCFAGFGRAIGQLGELLKSNQTRV